MAQDIIKSIWDRIPFLKPYALLARWDRPVGMWLTLWPALWSMALAPSFAILNFQQRVYFIALFVAGAVLVRGAGCTINDLFDRKLDAQVERTKARPLPSGQVKVWQAVVFLILQLSGAAWILFQLSPLAIYIGCATVPLVALYPLMKRITWLPQVFLGIVFNLGTLIAWAALENNLNNLVPFLLYLSAFCWTMAYDTVYAHMDVADDATIGIKSTARLWGPDSKTYVFWFWIGCLLFFFGALFLSTTTWLSYATFALAGLSMLAAHGGWKPLDDKYSLALFRLQAKFGFLLTLAALAPVLL